MKRSLPRLQRYVESMNSLQRLEDVRPQKSTVPFSSLCAHLRETGEILGKGDFSFSSQGDGSAFLDTELLFQVYENLLSNAGRYAQKQVWARAALERGWLSLSVGDDGPGFPPAALKRAAEPYYRADKSLSPQGELHFGLGLYLCREICNHLGHTIKIESALDTGTVVKLNLGHKTFQAE